MKLSDLEQVNNLKSKLRELEKGLDQVKKHPSRPSIVTGEFSSSRPIGVAYVRFSDAYQALAIADYNKEIQATKDMLESLGVKVEE